MRKNQEPLNSGKINTDFSNFEVQFEERIKTSKQTFVFLFVE